MDVNMSEDKVVQYTGTTSIERLNELGKGRMVALPGFDGDPNEPFVVRLRRPSMLVLAKSGKIPNALMKTATQLFFDGSEALDQDNDEMLPIMYDMCRVMCEASMVEPTLAEVENAGLQLTDEQLMAIFNYTQSGVKSLSPFRKE